MLYFTGIIISIYLLLLLIGKPNKSTADKLLTVWQLVATLHLADLYLVMSGGYRQFPGLLGWSVPFPLVHGPFLFLYIRHLTSRTRLKPWWLLHFLPALLSYALWFPLLFLSPAEKLVALNDEFSAFCDRAVFFNTAIMLSGAGYVIASMVLLYRYKRTVRDVFSNTEKVSLNWLRYLIGGMGVIWLFVIFYPSQPTIYVSVSLFICFIGFFGVRQKEIFSHNKAVELARLPGELPRPASPSVGEPVPVRAKYEGSGLSTEGAQRIREQLAELMEREKLFKDPELTLGQVAGVLQVHDAILSQVINAQFGKSFYDYINGLRVEAFKQLAADPANRNYTLLSLAFECGFNSKSSFNRNFKKMTGQPPSAFLKNDTPSH